MLRPQPQPPIASCPACVLIFALCFYLGPSQRKARVLAFRIPSIYLSEIAFLCLSNDCNASQA